MDKDRDGTSESYWFDLRYHLLKEAEGAISGIIVVATDVSARVLAGRGAQQQWRMFDAALSNTPDYMYIFDRDRRFTNANRQFGNLFQRPTEEIIGKGLEEIGYPTQLAETLVGQIREVIESWQQLWDETPFAGPDGQVRFYEYIFAPVFQENGSVDAVAGSSRDITERKRTLADLRRSLEELKRINRELEEFAYVSSHDLQEPLRTVTAYAQLLVKRHLGDDPQAVQYAGFIRSGVKRMEELIRDLLSFSRVVHAEGEPLGTADLSLHWTKH